MKKLLRSIAAALVMMTLAVAVLTVVPDSTAVKAEAAKIKLSKNSITLSSGKKTKITFKNVPKTENIDFQFSTNSKYCTVSSSGVIKAKNFYEDKTAKIKVKVSVPRKNKKDLTFNFTINVKLKGNSRNPAYKDAQSIENALKQGKKLSGQAVRFVVQKNFDRKISIINAYAMTASDKLYFVSLTSPTVKAGQTATVRVVKVVRILGKYYIYYDGLK